MGLTTLPQVFWIYWTKLTPLKPIFKVPVVSADTDPYKLKNGWSGSKLLGHTKIATTQTYAKVLETKVGQDMNALRELLKRKNNPESLGKQNSF